MNPGLPDPGPVARSSYLTKPPLLCVSLRGCSEHTSHARSYKGKCSPKVTHHRQLQEKGPPVVEEGTDDFGSDRVELQVRDVVEVLLAGYQGGGAPGSEKRKQTSESMFITSQAVFFYPEQTPHEQSRMRQDWNMLHRCVSSSNLWTGRTTEGLEAQRCPCESDKRPRHPPPGRCSNTRSAPHSEGSEKPGRETLSWPFWNQRSRMLAWSFGRQCGRSSTSEKHGVTM